MHQNDLSPRLEIRASMHARSALRWLLCLLAQLLALLAVGGVFAATSDPIWPGTTAECISHGDQDKAYEPDIAIDSSGRLIAVWSDERGGGRDIYTATNDGSGWSAPQVVSATVVDSWHPKVLAVEDQAFVVWIDPPITVTEHGRLYEAEIGAGTVRPITSPVDVAASQPGPAAGGGRLHVVFAASDSTIPDIYHASRLLTETAWPTPTRIYTSTAPRGSWWPALATSHDGATLHAVWENRESQFERSIGYMSGTANGAAVSWSSAITLSTGITAAIHPAIAVDSSGNVHVVWAEMGPAKHSEQYVWYTRYDTASSTWTTPTRVDPVSVEANQMNPTEVAPSLALWEDSQVEVCVAWYGYRTGDYIAEEVLLRCSPDGGSTWSSLTRNASRTTTDNEDEVSMRPAIAFDATGHLHVMWQEHPSGAGDQNKVYYEIYYAAELMNKFYFPLIRRDG